MQRHSSNGACAPHLEAGGAVHEGVVHVDATAHKLDVCVWHAHDLRQAGGARELVQREVAGGSVQRVKLAPAKPQFKRF